MHLKYQDVEASDVNAISRQSENAQRRIFFLLFFILNKFKVAPVLQLWGSLYVTAI